MEKFMEEFQRILKKFTDKIMPTNE